MLVANTIEFRRRSPSVICLETTFSIRIIGAFLLSFPFYLIILTSGDSYPSKVLMIVCLALLVSVGIYLFGRFKRICFDAETQQIYHWITFFWIPLKSQVIAFNQVTDFKIEERSFGQTFQQKLRLFLVTDDSQIDIGIINQKKTAEAIKKKVMDFILPDTNL